MVVAPDRARGTGDEASDACTCPAGRRIGHFLDDRRRPGRGPQRHRDRGRHLRREPQLRQSLRSLPRRQRPRQGAGRALCPARPRRRAAQGAAAGLGRPDRQGRRAAGDRGRDRTPAQHAVRDRRSEGLQDAARRRHPRSVASVLPEPDADQRRQERPLRRLCRFRRAGHGLLRRLEAAAVVDRQAIHAGRQFLHGRLRRLVPQSFLAGLRLHAGLSARRREPGQEADRGRRG